MCHFVKVFLRGNAFQRCDELFNSNAGPICKLGTYFNDITGCESRIDYFVTNDTNCVKKFEVLDPDINLFDHRPIVVECATFLHVGLRLSKVGQLMIVTVMQRTK